MTCEAEQARVDQLSRQVAEQAAQCASICSSLGQDSTECQGCRSELADLQAQLQEAQQELQQCLTSPPPQAMTRLLQLTGYLTFLRVNEPGSGFGGGSSNWFDADVIFKLDSRPDKAFGFQLRDDGTLPVRQGMLELLHLAVAHGLAVTTDYNELIVPPNNNSFVIRVALQTLPTPAPASGLHQVKTSVPA